MRWWERAPLPAPLPATGERGKKITDVRGEPKPKGGRRFRQPPVSPSTRWPIRETGAPWWRQAVFRFRQGTAEPCVPAVAVRPLAGHRDGGGSEEPRSRLDVLAIPSRLAAFRHRGPVIDRHDPRRVVPLDHLASAPSPEGFRFRRGCGCIFPTVPKALPLRCNPLHPVRRRVLRPWLQARPVALRLRPLPVRLSPPARVQRMPLDACPFRSRKADANIAFTVFRGGVPVPIHAVSRRHLHGSGRDKHLISLWFPAAASSACPMMLSWFSSRAKRRSTVTICG